MLQVDIGLPQPTEEQTEIISSNDHHKTNNNLQQSKIIQYSSVQIQKNSKIPIIILLLIAIFYFTYSLINVRILMDENQIQQNYTKKLHFKKQQKLSKDGLPVFYVIQEKNHSKMAEDARNKYLQAKSKRMKSSAAEKMEEMDDVLKARFEFESLLASDHPDPAALQLLENGDSHSHFAIPTLIWVYMNRPLQTQSYINYLTIANNIRIAKSINYTLNFINRDNYDRYLPGDALGELDDAIESLHRAGRNSEDLEQIIKYLVATTVLERLGGVFLEDYVSLLEGFQWLENIGSNIFLNRGERNVQPQVFGFYSVQHSSPLLRQHKPEVAQVKQYMRLFPAVEHYFLAARPHAAYLLHLKQKLIENMKKSDDEIRGIARELQSNKKAYKNDQRSNSIWVDLFIICSQQVLIKEQQRLITTMSTNRFAIDSYGLKTINKYYFPYKLDFIFTKYQYEKTYTHLARHTLQQLQTTIGPLRYVCVITPRSEIDYLLWKLKQGTFEHSVISGSFVQIYLYNNTQQSFIIANPERSVIKTQFPKWSKLPKIIWLFWDKGFSNSHATNQLAKRNIQKYGALSGFKVIEVNKTNLKDYIGLTVIERIDEALYFNNRGSKFDQTYSDLVRLALLIKHGGVYMDAAFMLLQDLSWLTNIAAYPSQYVFNRYGELPEVFMFFNPQYGSQYDEWEVDSKHNTKAHWHLSYENNFIACQPKNQLIIAWFDTLLNYLTQPYSQTEQQFKDCGIYRHKWSSEENTYLLPMDTIKCVIGKKQKELAKQANKDETFSRASRYYKVWSISGYNGVQKFRGFTNFQNPGSDDNLFFRRYSEYYVSSLLGKPRELIKLYSLNNINLNDFIRDNLEEKIYHEIHHRSFFNNYLFSLRKDDEGFIIVNDNLLIKDEFKEE